MAKITFGYVSKANPFIDRKAWSGTIFKIRESIEQAGYTVRWIPYTTPFFSKFILGLYHLYAKLTGKNIVYSHIPLIARMEAHSIDKKLIAGCDMLFFSGGSQVLSRIETDKPVFYLSDATFELMVDYYWPNLAACSVRYGNTIEQRALDKASVIIHSSEWASNSARDYYHIPASKLNVIEFGANIDENKIQTPVKQEFAGGGYLLRILFSGVDWERKGGEIAVDTVMQLNAAGIRATLYVAGIKDLPQKHRDNPHVKNIGFLNKNIPEQYHQYVQLWQQADILLLPTRAECSAIVYCEAAAHGIPVFTTDTGGIANYVVNGVNGYRLPLTGTGADFANKIKECICKQEFSGLSENARRLYKEKLSWPAWSSRFAEMVETYSERENQI